MQSFVIIAHRGFSSRAPENTIAAFDLAATQGFTHVELDVQLSKDNQPVIIHDSDIARTTNSAGLVASKNSREMEKVDAGSWFAPQFKDEAIPQLGEVLDRYQNKLHLHIELKSKEPELPSIVAKTLAAHRWLDTSSTFLSVPGVTITSANTDQLERSLTLLPDVDHHWLSWDLDQEIINHALKLGVQGLGIEVKSADPQLVSLARRNDLTIRGLGVQRRRH